MLSLLSNRVRSIWRRYDHALDLEYRPVAFLEAVALTYLKRNILIIAEIDSYTL